MRTLNVRIKKDLFLSKSIFLLLMLFLFVFPKGGFKLSSLPITWGYILIGITSLTLFIRKKYVLNKNHLYCLIALFPLQICSLLAIALNGYENFGFLISFLVCFFALPFFFFFILSEHIENIDFDFFIKIFKRGFLFISAYGIFLFFYKIITGSFLEIPFLTMNFHDIGILESKNITRKAVFKLISTYNNGNLYGISLIMGLGLYNLVEKSFWKKAIVKFSFILAFSRTVWIGLFLSELLFDIFIRKNKRVALIKAISTLLIITLLLGLLIHMVGLDTQWLLDRTFANRSRQFRVFENLEFFPTIAYKFIAEMVYLSALEYFGVIGFICFLLALFFPINLYLLKNMKIKNDVDKCILIGLITYLFISISDGGMLYIPTMVFYWFLASLLLRKNIKSYHLLSDTTKLKNHA